MAVLEELYNGNINPSEKYVRKDSEFHKQTKLLADDLDSFLEMLSEEEKVLFEKIETDFHELNYISEKESFSDGFCLGVKLILEIIQYKSKNFL